MGDYNAAKGKMLVIKFDICRDAEGTRLGDRKCKEEKDIMQWLNRKFLVTMENEILFQKDKVEIIKLTKQSKLTWNVLSPQLRTDNYNYVQLTDLDLNDSIGAVTSDSTIHRRFSIVPGPFRLYDFPDNT